ncbi:MAG TPA: type IV toxin-antitoxin system AbiEi family antitoxin domain-containing protein [Jatrophihabitans sp.]|nr:type IV toxin-antitoxin system AbiEi family antitoxin domain-containing protein [Jatrophihabitans sp.]
MSAGELPDLDWYLDHVVVPSGIERRPVGPVRAWQGWWAAVAHRLSGEVDGSPLGAATGLALRQGFVLTRAQARDCGLSDPVVRRLLRRGTWVSCGHGTLAVVGEQATNAYEAARRSHALRATGAALRRRGHGVGFASAAMLHGLPVLSLPMLPELVAATGPVTTGRRSSAHVRHGGPRPAQLTDWFGAPVTSIAQSVVDLARIAPRSGLMAADAALHGALLEPAELRAAIDSAALLPGIRRAREVLALASPLIESPLESITHLALHDAGLPAPKLQIWLPGADGRRYRVDFLWPQLRLVLEADGRDKYRDDALWTEKRRQLALTRADYRVERVIWSDVIDGTVPPWLVQLFTNPRT